MAELDAFNILTKGGIILPVDGVVGNPTITPRPVHLGGGVAFGLGANEVNGGMGGVFAASVIDADTPADSFILDAGAYYEDTPDAASVLGKHDHVTLTTPRHNFELVDFIEWWDGDPGYEHDITITGSSGSNLVTVSDIRRLTVGQGISSSGNTPIPADTVICGLYATPIIGAAAPVFTARLSKALVAIATNSVAVLSGSNLRSSISMEDYRWHGIGFPVNVS